MGESTPEAAAEGLGVQQAYLLWSRSMLELVQAADLDAPDN